MDEQILLSLTTEELFRVFIAKKRDLLEKDEEGKNFITEGKIEQVKNGVKIKFSLSKYFRYKDSTNWGIFRQKPKANVIRADESGYVKMEDFYEELEERNGIMLNALLDYYGEDDDPIESDTNIGLVKE